MSGEFEAAPETPRAALDAPARRRRVLLYAMVFVIAALALQSLAPWILPAYIDEGPLLQQVTPTSAIIVCYTSRDAGEPLSLALEPAEGAQQAARAGRRQAITLNGLAPGAEYHYSIKLGQRTLAEARFQTPTQDQDGLRFIVFGDSGKGTRAQYLLSQRMIDDQPDFLLHTGDLIYPDGRRSLFKTRFFEPYQRLIERAAFWPCLGNHDVAEQPDEAYLDVFQLPENGPPGQPPERSYWFDYGDARFMVIDSTLDEASLRDQVAPWAMSVLSEPAPRWRFVAMHHPPYTIGQHVPDARIQAALVPIFEQTGVDVVFAGHDHTYQRTRPMRQGAPAPEGEGVVYVVTGAGGARLYPLVSRELWPDYFAFADSTIHSYTRVELDDRAMSLEQVDVDGRILDQWTYPKPEPQPQ